MPHVVAVKGSAARNAASCSDLNQWNLSNFAMREPELCSVSLLQHMVVESSQ